MQSSDIVFLSMVLLTWITGVVYGNNSPSNTCVTYGSSAVLECSLDDDVIQHWVNPIGDIIAENDRVAEGYQDKIRIEGEYDLVVINATYIDAGTYQCVDSTATDSPSQAEVVVIETTQRVHYNNSGKLLLEGEALELTCDLRFAGNIKPTLFWTNSGQVLNSIPANRPGFLQSSIVVSGVPNNNGKQFICSVSFEEFPNMCTMDDLSLQVIVHYKPRDTNITKKDGMKLNNNENIFVNDVLVCSSNCFPPVSTYTWRALGSRDDIGTEQELTVTSEHNGLTGFECLVNNYMGSEGNIEGADSAEIYLNVYEIRSGAEPSDGAEGNEDSGKNGQEGLSKGAIAGIVVACLVVVAVAAVCCCVCGARTQHYNHQEIRVFT